MLKLKFDDPVQFFGIDFKITAEGAFCLAFDGKPCAGNKHLQVGLTEFLFRDGKPYVIVCRKGSVCGFKELTDIVVI